jgi:hypothetical protein
MYGYYYIKTVLVVLKGEYKKKAINTGPLQLWKSIKHARNVRKQQNVKSYSFST